MVNFAPTTPKLFALAAKNPPKIPDHAPEIGIK
jgi:hypothetical protein